MGIITLYLVMQVNSKQRSNGRAATRKGERQRTKTQAGPKVRFHNTCDPSGGTKAFMLCSFCQSLTCNRQ